MAERITGRLPDGTVFVRSETGKEGVGHFTTQRRLPEIVTKLAELEDKIENGNLVEVVHGAWAVKVNDDNPWDSLWTCSICGANTFTDEPVYKNYCPNCGADMRGDKK